MSNDGLSTDEKVNLLFKNYMNFTSTLDSKAFFEETALANNTNIFSDNILSSTPSTNPTFGQAITNDATLSSLLETGMPDISINNTWLNTKTGDGGTFQEDASSTILRLNRIKLDYVTNGGASFICKDNEGNNILQNLIPSNYAANGYSLSLEYKDGSSIKSVPWLAPRGNTGTNGSLSKILGTNVSFGGALFDAKNGIVTFYDVTGDPNSVFSSAEFYLSATKYIGPKGAAASGSGGGGGGGTDEAAVKALIDASLNAHYYTQTYIDGSLNAVRSDIDTSLNAHYISKNTQGNVVISGNLDVDGSINFTGEFIKTDTVVRITEQIDVSNDGTGPALKITQHGVQPVAEFYDDASLVMVIKNGGDASFNKNISVGGDLSVNGLIHCGDNSIPLEAIQGLGALGVTSEQVDARIAEFANPFNYQTDFTTFDSEDFGLLQENETPFDYPISFDSDITTFDNQDFAISRPNEFAASVGDLSINQLRTNQLFLAGELRQF